MYLPPCDCFRLEAACPAVFLLSVVVDEASPGGRAGGVPRQCGVGWGRAGELRLASGPGGATAMRPSLGPVDCARTEGTRRFSSWAAPRLVPEGSRLDEPM